MPETDGQTDYETQLGGLVEDREGEDDLDRGNLLRLGEASVTGTDWTTETILRQLERGNIKLNPQFQRRDAWRSQRKSRFIESLIIGLPIPQLVLAEAERGSYIVIDGKQRLLSLRQFTAQQGDPDYNPLALVGLELRDDLNGKTYQDLQASPNFANDVRAFQNQPIRTLVIKGWRDEDVLYLIFLRLNTGSVQLSPQELRQALHPGPFVRYVTDASGEMTGLRRIFKTSQPDFRMRDAELLVRYFAFRNFLSEYNGNLKKFLDLTCNRLNDAWPEGHEELEGQTQDLQSAIDATFRIFGADQAFKRWDGSRYEGRFNRAVFDVMTFYFVNERIRRRAQVRKSAVVADFKRLCDSNRTFLGAIVTTTKSLDATVSRLGIWGNTLRRRLQIQFDVPALSDGRIEV